MRKLHWLGGVLLLVGMMGGALLAPVRGEEKDAKTDDPEVAKAKDRAEMIKDMATAARLVEFGRKYKAPEALITAAGLLNKVIAGGGGAIEDLSAPVEDEKGNKLDVAAEKDKSLKEQIKDLFDEAEGMGVPVNGLIKAAKAREYKTRGAAGGPKRISRKIVAGGAHVYTITFKGGWPAAVGFQSTHPARVRIISPGQGDLQNSVVTTTSYTWRPGRNTPVKIHVNALGHNAHYTITTN